MFGRHESCRYVLFTGKTSSRFSGNRHAARRPVTRRRHTDRGIGRESAAALRDVHDTHALAPTGLKNGALRIAVGRPLVLPSYDPAFQHSHPVPRKFGRASRTRTPGTPSTVSGARFVFARRSIADNRVVTKTADERIERRPALASCVDSLTPLPTAHSVDGQFGRRPL